MRDPEGARGGKYTFACPTCGKGTNETPRACDYCHEHVASIPSENGEWICDYCIMQALVGPAAYAEILEVQSRLARTRGQSVSLGDAFTAWRESTGPAKIAPRETPAPEVNAHAS